MGITYAIAIAALGSMLMLVPSIAMAKSGQGVHLVGAAPTCHISGSTVTCSSFELAGLGSTPATSQLIISGHFTTQCTNKGGNVAPGQNSATGTASSPPTTVSTDKNGRSIVQSSSATLQPPSQTQLNALCPNSGWTGSVSGFVLDSASITVTQNGAIVFQINPITT